MYLLKKDIKKLKMMIGILFGAKNNILISCIKKNC
jgi:hypothetical protein